MPSHQNVFVFLSWHHSDVMSNKSQKSPNFQVTVSESPTRDRYRELAGQVNLTLLCAKKRRLLNIPPYFRCCFVLRIKIFRQFEIFECCFVCFDILKLCPVLCVLIYLDILKHCFELCFSIFWITVFLHVLIFWITIFYFVFFYLDICIVGPLHESFWYKDIFRCCLVLGVLTFWMTIFYCVF